MKKYLGWKLLAVLIVAGLLGFFNLPGETQSKIIPFTPESIQRSEIQLGLDLRGGSQLEYRVDLRRVPEEDRTSIVEGVRSVIERRVDALGVAEPNIYISEVAGETYIMVELVQTATIEQADVEKYLGSDKHVDELTPEERRIVSLEKAKETVGRTIQLEFKEQKDEPDPEERERIKEKAQNALNRIQEGEDFDVIGQEEQQAFPGRVTFSRSDYTFESDLSSGIKAVLTTLDPGQVHEEIVEIDGDYVMDPVSGEPVQDSAFAIIKLEEVKDTIRHETAVETSHILISWEGLDSADATVTRNEEEASELAEEIRQRIIDGEDFSELAAEYSDDRANKNEGGVLPHPVTGDGTYVSEFEEAALELGEGEISRPVETQFGHHIIKATSVQDGLSEKEYRYKTIRYSTMQDMWEDTGLTGQHFVRASAEMDQFFQPFVSIQFDSEGAKLFEELTAENINKPIAIFVGGELISAPRVNERISGGTAQITGNFTTEEAQTLARDLNTGAIPAPIVLTGEYTIGATLGQEALSMSLKAGFIGLLLVMVFMIAYYRLPGVLASVALSIYGIILLFLIKSQLHLALSLLLAIIIFGILVHRIANNKDSGWEKLVSFILTCAGLFFITYLFQTGIVLTLAGIAGIILSIGMAVDANILIFERVKEELRDGKSLRVSIENGFERAWSAIRDSNFSTLITCAILFYFGTSMIRGFAFTLAAGILVSMFTALVITKMLLYSMDKKRSIPQCIKLFGGKEKAKRKPLKFIQKTKLWFSISGVAVGLALISIFTFGLNLGIDFTGGSLIELRFKEDVTREQVEESLHEAAEEVNKEVEEGETTSVLQTAPIESPEENSGETSEETLALKQAEQPSDKIDLTAVQIIRSGDEGFIIKTRHLTPLAHDKLMFKLREKLPEFTEERFMTIGPVVGSALLQKAIIAVIVALIIIIFYVAFAFRKIPKEINPWRFGASAIVALLHDVIIIMGIFAILGHFLHVELDALFITALLTIFGYSVNDTIVVLDRLREKILVDSDENLTNNANKALTETLARSINTSLSTLLVLGAILIGGSSAIFYFILALALGIFVGTYSSLFVATPLLVLWKNVKTKKM